MKIVYRRLLQFSALVVFLALAPLIIFYAMGYRLAPASIDPLPVGVLVVESIPRRAEVLVDGQSVGVTPVSVSNILPGTIDVVVRASGYREWRKELAVEPTTVTEARSVLLVPSENNIQRLMGNIQRFSLAPNRELIAALDSGGMIHILDERGQEIAAPVRVTGRVTALLWSPDSSTIALISPNAAHVVDISNISRGIQPLALTARNIQDLAWDPRIPGRLLMLDKKNVVSAYSIDTQETTPLIAGVRAFATSSRNLYTVSDDNVLTIHDLQGHVVEARSAPFEKDVEKLHVTPAGRSALQFTDSGVAVIGDDKEVKTIAETSHALGWSPDGQLLLIQTEPGTLYVYNAADERIAYLPVGTLNLTIRLSRSIHSAQWFAGGRHIIYQTDDEIMVTEIDTRGYPVTYEIDTTNLGESEISVGKGGETVFYLKHDDSTTSLVALPLVVE